MNSERGPALSLVGIIANPASGKDIRRLVAYGSVFDNQEKVRIVRRILMGLTSLGVDQVCFMPDYYGIVLRAKETLKTKIPIFPANFKPTASQSDSINAARIMEERGAGCIVTLGGDGTNRAVAKGNQRVPMLPVSTGTNNVFPYMVEATLAGLAAGLVAQKLVSPEESLYHSTRLEIVRNGEVVDLALVDAAVYDDPFIGSRAVWNMEKVRQVFLNRAEPDTIGLSSIGGLIRTVKAEEPCGLNLILGTKGRRVTAPVAPGIIQTVIVEKEETMALDEEMDVILTPSVLALDGEREIELKAGQKTQVKLTENGPLVVDVSKTMTAAAQKGIFLNETGD